MAKKKRKTRAAKAVLPKARVARRRVSPKSPALAEPADKTRIDDTSMGDLEYWCKELGTGYTQIKHAVAKVGHDPEKVRNWLFEKFGASENPYRSPA